MPVWRRAQLTRGTTSLSLSRDLFYDIDLHMDENTESALAMSGRNALQVWDLQYVVANSVRS